MPTEAGGTHPTGMLSCIYFSDMLVNSMNENGTLLMKCECECEIRSVVIFSMEI